MLTSFPASLLWVVEECLLSNLNNRYCLPKQLESLIQHAAQPNPKLLSVALQHYAFAQEVHEPHYFIPVHLDLFLGCTALLGRYYEHAFIDVAVAGLLMRAPPEHRLSRI